MGKMANILVVDLCWSFLNGLLLPMPTVATAVGVSIVAWCIFALIAVMILSNEMIATEAKKRTNVTPITSFDQQGSIVGALMIIGVIGIVGFVIGYTISSAIGL